MVWTVIAGGVVLLHAAFLLFQMLGALLALASRGWLIPHLVTVTWGIGIVVVQGGCPLTGLEKRLIEAGGGTPYSGSFLDHYLFGTVLPDGTQALVYGLHLVVIVATYAYVVPRLRQRRAAQGLAAAGAAEPSGGGNG